MYHSVVQILETFYYGSGMDAEMQGRWRLVEYLKALEKFKDGEC